MKLINHDPKLGYLKHCQICNSKKMRLIIDLGKQPLADTLLTKKNLKKKVKKFPLSFYELTEIYRI